MTKNHPTYFSGVAQLRQRVTSSDPPRAVLASLQSQLSDPDLRREFFALLDSPKWLEPLNELGYFDNPPVAKMVDGRVYCDTWPQSQYLARIAALAPESVLKILGKLTTDNWIIARDLISAIKAMPAKYIARLASKLIELVESLKLTFELVDVAQIVAKLAENKEADVALDIASRCFSPDSRDPRSRDDLFYIQGLNNSIVPALVKERALPLLKLLAAWLENTIVSARSTTPTGDDYSYIWRVEIESDRGGYDSDFASNMVDCFRDGLEKAVECGSLSLLDSLELLANRRLLIFRRFRLHMITEFATQNAKIVRMTILDKNAFCDYRLKHEYSRLIGKTFSMLTDVEQAQWLEWIDTGFGFDKRVEGDDADEEKNAKRMEYWRFVRLHWIRDHLKGNRREVYEQGLKAFGLPELADRNFYVETGYGTVSPFSIDDLRKMRPDEALERVLNWNPNPKDVGFRHPSREGLLTNLEQLVTEDTLPWSQIAESLIDKPLWCVGSYLSAVRRGVKDGKDVELRQLLPLLKWVADLESSEADQAQDANESTADRRRLWCKDSVAELIDEICKARIAGGQPKYEIMHKDRLWEIVESFRSAPVGTDIVSEVGARDPRIENWTFLAVNSHRGKAMLAVFSFAEWIAAHQDPQWQELQSPVVSLADMPRVRALLESQLTRSDADFTERAVFGWKLGVLLRLDPIWLNDWVDRTFELEVVARDASKAYGWAAWNVFLYTHRPHSAFYGLLKKQFSFAVDQAALVEKQEGSQEKPFEHLAEHLMVLFGRGIMGSEAAEAFAADNSIIERLVIKSKGFVRVHAMTFVGNLLKHDPSKVPTEVAQRFQWLWEKYWTEVGGQDAAADPTTWMFGGWFESGLFESAWSLTQLEEFVSAVPRTHAARDILKRLADICGNDPCRSARIVGILVRGDRENWNIRSWKEHALVILSKALEAGGDAASEAETVVDVLGRRGFSEFGALLEHR